MSDNRIDICGSNQVQTRCRVMNLVEEFEFYYRYWMWELRKITLSCKTVGRSGNSCRPTQRLVTLLRRRNSGGLMFPLSLNGRKYRRRTNERYLDGCGRITGSSDVWHRSAMHQPVHMDNLCFAGFYMLNLNHCFRFELSNSVRTKPQLSKFTFLLP